VKNLRNHCRKGTSNGKFVSVSGGDIPGFLSEKTVRNFSKWLKTHLQNGSIYFSRGSFPQKVNILGEITAKKGAL
jgi:hypothetical protein